MILAFMVYFLIYNIYVNTMKLVFYNGYNIVRISCYLYWSFIRFY